MLSHDDPQLIDKFVRLDWFGVVEKLTRQTNCSTEKHLRGRSTKIFFER